MTVSIKIPEFHPSSGFFVGDPVAKVNGYEFDSVVVAVFRKLDGEERLVCESILIQGLLHIFSPSQMELRDVL